VFLASDELSLVELTEYPFGEGCLDWFEVLTQLKPLKIPANADQNLGKRWTPLEVQARAPRVLFLEDSAIARVYQCKSIAVCDHGIVTTKTLLLEMLILFGSDEFLF